MYSRTNKLSSTSKIVMMLREILLYGQVHHQSHHGGKACSLQINIHWLELNLYLHLHVSNDAIDGAEAATNIEREITNTDAGANIL